jgi:hypothetical protein
MKEPVWTRMAREFAPERPLKYKKSGENNVIPG